MKYESVCRAIDEVYRDYAAGLPEEWWIKDLASLMDELIFALPRWVTADMLLEALASAVINHKDM